MHVFISAPTKKCIINKYVSQEYTKDQNTNDADYKS